MEQYAMRLRNKLKNVDLSNGARVQLHKIVKGSTEKTVPQLNENQADCSNVQCAMLSK